MNRAAVKFKENFTEEITPVTMSAFLSDELLQKKVLGSETEVVNGEYVKVYKHECSISGCANKFINFE
jgi:hypothetical protein